MIYLNVAASAFPRREAALAANVASLNELPGDGRSNSLEQAVENHRQVVAGHFGVESERISFFSGATLALNILAMAWANSPECTVACDNRSHNAVSRVVSERRTKRAIVAQLWDRTTDALCPLELESLCAARPNVIFLTATSNVTGTHYPVSDVITKIRHHSPGSIIVVDGAQRLGSGDALECLDADAVVFAGHKHLGAVPGCALVVSKSVIPQVLFGGTGVDSANARTQLERRTITEVGTPNEPAIAALTAALNQVNIANPTETGFLNSLAIDLITEFEGRGFGRAISSRRGERAPIVSVIPTVGHPEAIWAPLLGRYGITVRGGLHCSPVTYRSIFEPNGALRISLGFSNGKDDVDDLLSACGEITKGLL